VSKITDSAAIFSIEVISFLRLTFDNLASPFKKFKLTSNTGLVLTVVEPASALRSLRSILIGFADILTLAVH
jgi:hypothetical protein